jgi:VanZ family protein
MSRHTRGNSLTLRERTIVRWLFVVASCIVILVYSTRPESSLPSLFIAGKYGIHFIEYIVLALLLEHALNLPWRNGWQVAVLAMTIAAMFGVIDEMIQAFAYGRVSQVYDWTIDAAGAVLGALIGAWLLSTTWLLSLFHQRWKKHRKQDRSDDLPSSDAS